MDTFPAWIPACSWQMSRASLNTADLLHRRSFSSEIASVFNSSNWNDFWCPDERRRVRRSRDLSRFGEVGNLSVDDVLSAKVVRHMDHACGATDASKRLLKRLAPVN